MKSNIANILRRLTVPFGARSDQPRIVIATDDPLAAGMTSAGVSYYSDDMRGFITSVERDPANGTGIWRLFGRFAGATGGETAEFVHVEFDPVDAANDYARFGGTARNAGEPGRLEFFGNAAKLSGDSIELNGPTTLEGYAVGAWVSYPAVWGSNSSPQPVVGNGSVTTKYTRLGKTVTVSFRIQPGTTSTLGTGFWTLSLPFPAAAGTIGAGSAVCFDADTLANRAAGVCWLASSTTLRLTATPGGDVSASAPFAWAASDQLRGTFTYETL